ncbi:DUF1292 domain-containing protein [Salisediminibacterium beveridgei]|uniref:UPF0473 protein BBEV_1138 n=1 Tax=Salisediminibacterium beveridgei TaxID=632773 RepID=A0A1D7QU14_9BACI|nr:DUF1292 domain-containing protein [Salisediminibacterium beveridgei]AOM82506.1 hypothetical protein BBEV_1138 [Salisediminibacterium beveridgei]
MADYQINEGGEQERIVIPDENGDEQLFEVLFTFDVDSTEKSYMLVVPEGSTGDEDDEVEVHAFRYEEDEQGEITLFPIETDSEWEMVEELLNTFTEEEDEE